MKALALRWLRYNVVAVGGFAVQVAAMAALVPLMRTHYVAASALAVEIAVLHNFAWNLRWTWRGRDAGGLLRLLLRYHATNGALSLAGTVALMPALVAGAGLDPRVANVAATIACGLISVVNFFLLDRYVFLKRLVRGPGL